MPYIFPTNKEIQQIGPAKVARMQENRLGFTLMPERSSPVGIIQWDQKDNYRGLQQLRGLDGSPSCISRQGQTRYSYMPGVYGEYDRVNESELTLRAGSVMTDAPIEVTDLVTDMDNRLLQREVDRKESIIWTLLTTGTFNITGPNGQAAFTDTFPLQTYNRAVAWATVATATPLADFKGVSLLGRGLGASFGAKATAYMNQATANNLMGNTNAADLGGKRVGGGNTIVGLGDINKILLDQGLPQVEVYDEGYYDDTNTFQLFIPNNVVVIVGARANGELIGEYLLTRNAVNDNSAPGPYHFIKDRTKAINGEKVVPPSIEDHRGHNGGPVIYFPGSIVIMTV